MQRSAAGLSKALSDSALDPREAAWLGSERCAAGEAPRRSQPTHLFARLLLRWLRSCCYEGIQLILPTQQPEGRVGWGGGEASYREGTTWVEGLATVVARNEESGGRSSRPLLPA